ncbi:MAG: MFS transporter, partial [Armatimonadota bacterium]
MDKESPEKAQAATGIAPTVTRATLALTLLIAFLGWMFDGMEMGLYSIAIRPALDDLMGTAQTARVGPIIGLTLSMFLTGMAAGGIVFGWLGDRIGRVKTMVITILVYAFFTGLSGLSQHWWQLAACRFLGSMGLGGEWGLGVALVMETWPNASRPLLAGVLGAAANFGFLASSGVGALQAHFGWSWRIVLVAGVAPAILTIFIRLAVKEPEKWVRAKERGEKPSWRELFGPVLRRHTLVGCGLGAVAVLGMWGAYQAWLQSWVKELVEPERVKAAIATTTFWMSMGAIVGALLGGLIGEWLGRRLSFALLCITAWMAAVALFLGCDAYGPKLLFFATLCRCTCPNSSRRACAPRAKASVSTWAASSRRQACSSPAASSPRSAGPSRRPRRLWPRSTSSAWWCSCSRPRRGAQNCRSSVGTTAVNARRRDSTGRQPQREGTRAMCSAHALGSSVWGLPVAALCMTSFVATAHGQPLSIVADGRPNAVIVAPTDADDQTRSAAETLASYIKQASGAVLEVLDESRQMDFKGVLIHVGPTTAAKRLAKLLDGLDEDGFVIDSTGGAEVLICGPSAWGTEFGVYEFLERYVGVRWLLPGPDGDDVPSASSIEVPREVVRQEPAFFSRLFSGLKGPAQARWARFNRMHGRIAFHHNLIRLFPPETYTKTHPEWFPMKDGKTRFLPPTNDTHGWQPCFSAPGLVEEAIKNICRYFEEHPEATSYSLGVNDSSGYCRCPECMARITGEDNFLGRTDFSDLYYDWANKVVEGVLEKHPDKWFGCLAYSEVAAPPKRVKVHPRIIPYMTYDRMKWIDPEVRAAGEQATRAWHETSPTLGWYDYIYGTPYCLPRVYFHHMADYYRFGRANGVRALYAEAYPNWGEGPKLYVSLKLQWAPDLDVDAILKEWYERCVGPKAAPSLARYYAIWERFWTERILDSKWFTVGGQYLRFNAPGYLADVDERDVAESRRLLESCVAEAETPKQRARAELLLRTFEYYEASALAYRADQVAATAALNTEADALAALDEAQRGLRMAERRRRLALNEFPNDPVLVHPLPIERYPPLAGQTWGSRAVWSLVDWLTKSDAVRRRVSELAEGSDSAAVREATGLMLA